MKFLSASRIFLSLSLISSSVVATSSDVVKKKVSGERNKRVQVLLKKMPLLQQSLKRHRISPSSENIRRTEDLFTQCVVDALLNLGALIEFEMAVTDLPVITCTDDGKSCTVDYSGVDISAGADICESNDMNLYTFTADFANCGPPDMDDVFSGTDDFFTGLDDFFTGSDDLLNFNMTDDFFNFNMTDDFFNFNMTDDIFNFPDDLFNMTDDFFNFDDILNDDVPVDTSKAEELKIIAESICVPKSCSEEIEASYIEGYEFCEDSKIKSMTLYGDPIISSSGSMNIFNRNKCLAMSLVAAGLTGAVAV